MRIVIHTFGSRGDVQPMIALAVGLKQAGHEVCVTSHQIFETFIRDHGLDFHPLMIDPHQVLIEQAVTEFGDNPVRMLRWMTEQFKPVLAELFQVTLAASQGADLLLNSALSFAGWHVAEKLAIPAVAIYLWPTSPTRAFSSSSAVPPAPSWLPFKGAYNYLSTKITNQMFFNLLHGGVNECRVDVLGLPPLTRADYWRLDTDKGVQILYGYSPSVLPRPADWGDNLHVTGYWFLDQRQPYEPSERLLHFLEAESPPVYIGFGSMVDHEARALTQLVSEALAMAGQRAVLLGGWTRLGGENLPETILTLDAAPHDWLFPRMAALVHHGGAGTTAAGLRAGVPTIVVPFFGDQAFWGWQVTALGAGPASIPRKKLTAQKLATAIEQAVGEDSYRQRAAEVGAQINTEDGVAEAVRFIERFMESGNAIA